MIGIIIISILILGFYLSMEKHVNKYESELRKIKNESERKEIIRLTNLKETENIARVVSNIGSTMRILTDIVEITPYNSSYYFYDKHYFPSLWRQVRITSIEYYPRYIHGIIVAVDERHSDLVKRTVNEIIRINFYEKDSNVEFILYEKFYEQYEIIVVKNEIDTLVKSIGPLTNYQFDYAKEQFFWEKYHEMLPLNIEAEMSGLDFERLIEYILLCLGYKTQLTKASSDHGVDIVAIDEKGVRIAIQTKRYTSKVGIAAVQEVNTGRVVYRCTDAWVITNSTFTPNAEYAAMLNNVRLIDGEKLTEMILGKLPNNGQSPEFNEERYKEIEVYCSKTFKFIPDDLKVYSTPFDEEILELRSKLNILYSKENRLKGNW